MKTEVGNWYHVTQIGDWRFDGVRDAVEMLVAEGLLDDGWLRGDHRFCGYRIEDEGYDAPVGSVHYVDEGSLPASVHDLYVFCLCWPNLMAAQSALVEMMSYVQTVVWCAKYQSTDDDAWLAREHLRRADQRLRREFRVSIDAYDDRLGKAYVHAGGAW